MKLFHHFQHRYYLLLPFYWTVMQWKCADRRRSMKVVVHLPFDAIRRSWQQKNNYLWLPFRVDHMVLNVYDFLSKWFIYFDSYIFCDDTYRYCDLGSGNVYQMNSEIFISNEKIYSRGTGRTKYFDMNLAIKIILKN